MRSSKVLLAVDIGNTVIHFAVFKDKRIVRTETVATVLDQNVRKELTALLRRIRQRYSGPGGVIICSVVPPATSVLEQFIKKELDQKACVVGRDVHVPLKNRYTNPMQVGQDRLVCAYAAASLYGVPAIVVDLGTAITVDVVSRRLEYLGGIIVPGIRITAETLFERTALLPLVEIKKPKNLIGKDTQGSILSGIFYGYGEMIRGLIRLLRQDIKTQPGPTAKPKVIVTGGHTDLMYPFIKNEVDAVDKNLVFHGLHLLSSEVITGLNRERGK